MCFNIFSLLLFNLIKKRLESCVCKKKFVTLRGELDICSFDGSKGILIL